MASLRSAKRRAPRRKYTVDAFEGIEGLQSSSASSDDANDGDGSNNGDGLAVDGDEDDDVDDDDDDDNDEFTVEPGSPDADDDLEMSELDDAEDLNLADDAGDSASDAGEIDLDDAISIADDPDDHADSASGDGGAPNTHRTRIRRAPDGQRLYTRGGAEGTIFRLSGKWRKMNFFGPIREDYEPVHRASAKWSGETTLPTRKPRKGLIGGFEYPPSYGKALREADANWKWYLSDGGQAAFQLRQIFRLLSAEDAEGYLVIEGNGDRSFLAGALNSQRLFQLGARQSIPLPRPFHQEAQAQPPRYKPGFLLNLGARVHALDWAPSQDGRNQFLAVSLLPKRDENLPPFQRPQAPSFTPQESLPSSIQFWQFAADPENFIDVNTAPHLALVLCTTIGEIKTLKWCPVPMNMSGKLGLLACIGSDGTLRIFDIDIPSSPMETVHIVGENPAFTARPPDTVCTCLSWISSSRIAVGCANGFVAVWDLQSCIQNAKDNPRPAIYASFSTSYILAVTSCWPSNPHLLAATSMSGRITLTDLRKSRPAMPTNTAYAIRTRLGQPMLVWGDLIQSHFSVDDSYMARSYLLRRFFTTIGVAKFRAQTLCMATSLCHPFLLAGTANGEVIGCNPIVRIALGGKAPLWQQIWFKHEWRRPTAEEETSSNDASTDDARSVITKEGLTRFSEGYKVENISLNSDGKAGANVKDGTLFATVYEERTAITALAWNPNLHVGGWAAAGMADGFLRVEDIAM